MRQHTKIRSFESEIIHAHTYLVIETYSFSIFLMLVIFSNARGGEMSCTKGAGSAQRRDPLRDKIREVGRGLSLADTQTVRYGRLYSSQAFDGYVRGVVADAQALLRILP